MDIYKFAVQHKLCFPSKRGVLNVEQLFELPLTSQTGFDLNSVAKGINAQLKGANEESFVEDTAASPERQRLTVALDVVKDVIATKQAENKATRDRIERAAERKKLLDAIAAKKDEKLKQADLDELQKRLDALDAPDA